MATNEWGLSASLFANYLKSFTDQLDKMESVEDFVRDDTYHGVKSGHHRAYKMKIGPGGETYLESADKLRRYEFMIEFDFEDTAYGIYYGCRGLIMGGNQEEQVRLFDEEWNHLRNEVCQVLNNTFPTLDFSGRFQLTNNASNKTYWPFWISLYAGEDIIDVAARATRLIAKVYRHFQKSSDTAAMECQLKDMERQTPRFTEEKYQEIIQEIIRHARNGGCRDVEGQVRAFRQFFVEGERQGLFVRDDRYELAWRVKNIRNVLIAAIIKKYCEATGLKDRYVPWSYFEDLIISEKGRILDDLKKSLATAKETCLQSADKTVAAMLNPETITIV